MALVTGIVVNENNEALENVHVYVKDSNPLVGVVTNSKGNFAINADAYKNLIISYAGVAKQYLVLPQPQFLRVEFLADELPEFVGNASPIAKPKKACGVFCALLIVAGLVVTYQIFKDDSEPIVPPKKLKI